MSRFVLFLLPLAIACSGGETEAPATPEAAPAAKAPTPVAAAPAPTMSGAEAGALAKEIKANPEQIKAILSKHNLTSAQFQEILATVAKDASESEAYTKALEG